MTPQEILKQCLAILRHKEDLENRRDNLDKDIKAVNDNLRTVFNQLRDRVKSRFIRIDNTVYEIDWGIYSIREFECENIDLDEPMTPISVEWFRP